MGGFSCCLGGFTYLRSSDGRLAAALPRFNIVAYVDLCSDEDHRDVGVERLGVLVPLLPLHVVSATSF